MNVNANVFVPGGSSGPPTSPPAQSTANVKKNRRPAQKSRNPRPLQRTQPESRSSHNIDNITQDLEAVDLSGSKEKKGKVSLNHLLGFSFPERQTPNSPSPRRQKTTYQPFNKERFVNANFRFVVRASSDYQVYLADPDMILDWQSIEQVVITATIPSCPICLSSPVTAARITKCGHIFCLPCVLHYFALRENTRKQWHKCPICWDAMYLKDLKNVRSLIPRAVLSKTTAGVQQGDTVQLSLLLRPGPSPLALPISDTWPISESLKRQATVLPWDTTPSALAFSRLVLASPDYLLAMYEQDIHELEMAQQDAVGWGDDTKYIEEAIDEAVLMQRGARGYGTNGVRLLEQTSALVWNNDNKLHGQAKDKAVSTSSLTDYYFFQADDGQHVYLHPLDVKVLKHAYGDYDRFPKHIEVVATGIEETTMTEELRKRYKHLSHLPLGCDVTFLEVDLKRLVPKDSLDAFEHELTARAKKRKDRVRREEKDLKIAEAKQKKQAQSSRQENQQLIENDPFFQMNQPMSVEENEAMLAQAIAQSAQESRGPKTVWGTRAVVPEEEQVANEWSEHITVTVKQKKKRGKK
ncbi:hypothetical protein CLU79DRAFT_559401 [Phycomyces nitens]|nr:hypothetical protein CLU79DRAFT_559401 [Phycomyces nitens]